MSVFRKREALLHHYVPETLPHRERELAELKRWFEPILSDNVNVKVHVYGPMGTGKTVLCNRLGRHLVDEAERRGVKLKFIHVNMAYTPKPYHVIVKNLFVHRYIVTLETLGYTSRMEFIKDAVRDKSRFSWRGLLEIQV